MKKKGLIVALSIVLVVIIAAFAALIIKEKDNVQRCPSRNGVDNVGAIAEVFSIAELYYAVDVEFFAC